MSDQLFNRSIFLWLIAVTVALLIFNPRAALIQRVNAMNGAYIDCVTQENCQSTKAITETRQYYKILDRLYPAYGRGVEMQGMCYLFLKQDDLAIKKFQEALKHNPNLFWVSFELGKTFYRRGQYAQALKYFQGISAQDDGILLRKADLSTLGSFSDKLRAAFMFQLVDFVDEIKQESHQMALGCVVHQENLAQSDSQKKILRSIDSLAYAKPAFHPWGHFIQPLKEILYQ